MRTTTALCNELGVVCTTRYRYEVLTLRLSALQRRDGRGGREKKWLLWHMFDTCIVFAQVCLDYSGVRMDGVFRMGATQQQARTCGLR